MIWRITLLVAMMALMSSLPVAAGTNDGVIDGQVINRTEGGSSTADVEVSLEIFAKSIKVGSITVQTDAEGRFVFDGLSTESGYSYQLTLTFQEAEYYSSTISYSLGENKKSVDIEVYNSTSSNEAVSVVMSYTLIYTGKSVLRVSEYYLFTNNGDKNYIGATEVTKDGDKETLRFTLPTGASDIQYETGLMESQVINTDDGFIYVMPLPPGHKEIAYSYNLVPVAGAYYFSIEFHHPVDHYTLAVQDLGNVEASSDQLTLGEPLLYDGSLFINLSSAYLSADTIITANLSGLPVANSHAAVIWAAVGLVVVAGGFGIGYLLKKKKSRRSTGIEAVAPNTIDDVRQKLLLEIAQLDDEFEAGKISKEQYHVLRSEKKLQLVELMRKPKVKDDGAYGG